MLISLPINKENKEQFYNLEEISVNKVINNYPNLEIVNNFLQTTDIGNIEKTKYIYKNICVEYVENISEPSKSVPTDKDFRYILKRNNEYLFKTENPKKLEVYDSSVLNSLVNSDYNLSDTIIAKELYTNENSYKVYSLPYGGIDKYDSFLFYVDTQNKIQKLESNVDYINGLIYTLPELNQDIKFIFGYFNLVPLKILPKGNINIEEQESDFYTVKNVDVNNYISIQYLSSTSMLLTTLKNMIIEVPEESIQYTIDGIVFVKGQTAYIEKNETIYIEKETIAEKNIEYLSQNTKLKESLDTSNKKDFIFIEKNKEEKVEEYLLKIVNKENTNTYMKQTPLILKLF